MTAANKNSSAHVCTTQTTADYIANLPAWDKVPRLGTWLPHVLNESVAAAGEPRMDYLSLVGKYWLLAIVRRVMEPGCKFDYCPVLEGMGGLRKSTLAEVLAGKEHFEDSPITSCWRCIPEELQNLWIYEVAELSALNKAEKAEIKSFITGHTDACREPWCKSPMQVPRQFIVIGTSNEDSYRSQGSDRHFWPVPVHSPINIEWVRAARDQLFAEAKEQQHLAWRMPDLTDHPGNPAAKSQWGGV